MAAEASRSGTAVDSYIGSLISLTSKSEIRYEGILFNINTEESNIGLRNVRSFGTEGRKKDGPQIPASDKIYEYILFRGSDIKDLQVKSSPPPQPAPIHNDPAIIQSHYSHPPASTSLPSAGSETVADNSHTAQLGISRSTFPGGLPPFQSGASLGSWGSSTPAANESGIAMPTMYWQGYYAPTGGLPHIQQPSMLRPPPGLPVHPSMQQPLQYPAINTSISSGSPGLTDYRSPLLPPIGSSPSLTSMTLPPMSAPAQASSLAAETLPNLMPNKSPVASFPASSIGPTLPSVPPITSSLESIPTMAQRMPSIVGSKPRPVLITSLPYQSTSQSVPSNIGQLISSHVETSVPLVTPIQLFQPPSSLSSSQPSETIVKEVESKLRELPEAKTKLPVPEPSVPSKTKLQVPEPSVSTPAEVKEPILPLPTKSNMKPYDIALQSHPNHRGRGRARGRGNGHPRPVTKFTEDFDFTAMNEKFNKDEVWGHLGKSKSHCREGNSKDDEVDYEEDDEADVKPGYVKDDFFDSLSCNTLDRGQRNGRTKFSEQLKIDTETFGDFQRHRLNRGGGRGFRGGGRSRGSYYGRGYGYAGRGRGNTAPYRTA
ncbi:protein LSM14 protein [Dioscorea alata]|uniref:Protein LSM14 protein n=1 Tax=Dioscorea alata TaxID=55571 RepID=A0ACB7TTG5_DIOAL|nr:protein LSM14 protein [Dioscorea alata]